MKIGLRIDVDTFRGTRSGVPPLCAILARHAIRATFFFSVGPDNMGRHLGRLRRPAFLAKMLRTRAASLYGWDILLRGVLWPGPVIGERLGGVIRAAAAEGHEIGLHAWDHHAWQAHLEEMDGAAIHRHLSQGVDLLDRILGRPPLCSAAPGWRCNNLALLEKAEFPFKYNSDCRGGGIFQPRVNGETLAQPQVPVTLPTYDEAIGREGVTDDTYNDSLLSLLVPGGLNVLAIHAEVEGIARAEMFERFVEKARAGGASFVTLGKLLADARPIPASEMAPREIPGREGWVSCQVVEPASSGSLGDAN